jgi:hypothetical protein
MKYSLFVIFILICLIKVKAESIPLSLNSLPTIQLPFDTIKEIELAKERLKYEVRAKQVMIPLDAFSTDIDTFLAFEKINNLRSDVLSGKISFDSAIKMVINLSETDESDLGYFTEFEAFPYTDIAFNTNLGEISKVFRTSDGYHFLKVIDKRKNTRPTPEVKEIRVKLLNKLKMKNGMLKIGIAHV